MQATEPPSITSVQKANQTHTSWGHIITFKAVLHLAERNIPHIRDVCKPKRFLEKYVPDRVLKYFMRTDSTKIKSSLVCETNLPCGTESFANRFKYETLEFRVFFYFLVLIQFSSQCCGRAHAAALCDTNKLLGSFVSQCLFQNTELFGFPVLI